MNDLRSSSRSLLLSAVVALAAANQGCSPSGAGGLFTRISDLGSSSIVISQVYGGGGNIGATYKNDFIELFNRSNINVGVFGWSVQYASTFGSTWIVTNISGVIQPGRYFLVREAPGAGGTTDLPTPDATGLISMSGTTGKVALVGSQTALTCDTGCLPNAGIVDFVGYGSSASSFEGSGPAPTLDNPSAALRASSGCTDTDNNAADLAKGAPTPRNSFSPAHPCGPTGTGGTTGGGLGGAPGTGGAT